MKALMLKDFYIFRKTMLFQLIIIPLSQLYFIIKIFNEGANPANILPVCILLQIVFVMSVGGIVLTEGAEKVREYLRATPIGEREYLKSKFITQFLMVLFISFVEIGIFYGISRNLLIVGTLAFTACLCYFVSLLYIFFSLKLGKNYVTVLPVGLYFIAFILSANFPNLLSDFVTSSYILYFGMFIFLLDVVLNKLFFKILLKELENYE
ncbi:ABC-2 transporter permease [Peptoniphilus indolicus]|uniref:Uncharacterized protein n=2 Tax=Peptoniphilus indolicus TaxID=33030 RepID=G4D638_9FIRM|nr:ABC-2 transporter permease [Peptoniphilus indolicus]EGY77438.1 hypothetical protein HMPREF9129_1868 [Peptoniphilus indolicus ATCC 29427]SUB74532.1 Uncharacterised protein [Peptoniphilus indolicus]